jgi:hypothetical protein
LNRRRLTSSDARYRRAARGGVAQVLSSPFEVIMACIEGSYISLSLEADARTTGLPLPSRIQSFENGRPGEKGVAAYEMGV